MPKGLQAELKQAKPFRHLEEEVFLGVVRTAAVLEHGLAQALKPLGVTPTQYNVLRILRGAGSEGMCRSAVADRLVRQVPDVTRLLDRMEDCGLIARERSGQDRRYVTTTITQKGLAALKDLDAAVTRAQQERLGHVSRGKLRAIASLLADLREGASG